MLIASHFALVWLTSKSFAESKFRGSDYTMVKSVSMKNIITPIIRDTLQ